LSAAAPHGRLLTDQFALDGHPTRSSISFHQLNSLQRGNKQVRTYAVKVEAVGWVGVSADTGRCQDHGHPTPELAKLCALHRAQPVAAEGNVILMPVPPPAPPKRRTALQR
jgi:hypothetical protein